MLSLESSDFRNYVVTRKKFVGATRAIRGMRIVGVMAALHSSPRRRYIYAMLGGTGFEHPSSPVTIAALVAVINIATTSTTPIDGVSPDYNIDESSVMFPSAARLY